MDMQVEGEICVEDMLSQKTHLMGLFDGAQDAFARYLDRRIAQPHFANARSVRNALDRARLRQASRLFADRDRQLTADDLTTLAAEDILASRVFGKETSQ